MNLTATTGQPGSGVRLIDMGASGAIERLRMGVDRVGYRLGQLRQTLVVRKAASLWLTDRDRFQAFLDYGRAAMTRSTPALSAMIEANAVRIAPPYPPMTSPPGDCEWFAPHKGEPRGFVFYVHGGSFICERSAKLTAMVARFASRANARVFAPSRRLAPEHRCPAAVDDIASAFRWFRKTWPDEPVVALAESSGAAVLLSALQRLRDEGETLPDGIVLLSPWVDLSLQSWSVVSASLAATSWSTMEGLGLMAHLYLQGRPATDPVASPIFGDFAGFPPMLIHASRGDILYDDAVRLADKVRDAGGDLTTRLWTAETHVWEQHNSPRARESIDLAADFIARCLD